MFTKRQVVRYAGHMADAAQSVADRWGDGKTIDLDVECRVLTLRALGRSVLGLDLDKRADAIGPALRREVVRVAEPRARAVTLPRG